MVKWGFRYEDLERKKVRDKLQEYYPGKIVRKDLTKLIKEGANVPIYVLSLVDFKRKLGMLI